MLAANQVLANQIFQIEGDHDAANVTKFKAVVDGVEEGADLWTAGPGLVRATFAPRPVGTYQAGIRAYGAGGAFSEALLTVEVVAAPPAAPANLRIVR